MRMTVKQLRALLMEAFQMATPAKKPKPGCPECQGTGLYTGFSNVETCRTCSQRRNNHLKPGDPNATCFRDVKAIAGENVGETLDAFCPNAYADMEQIISYYTGDLDNPVPATVRWFIVADGGIEAILTIDGEEMLVVYDDDKGWFIPLSDSFKKPGDPYEAEDWRDPDIRIA